MTILSSKEYLVLGVTLALSGSIGMAVIVAGHVIRCASNCSTIWVALEMSELTGFFNLFAFMSILGFGGLVVSLIMRIYLYQSNKLSVCAVYDQAITIWLTLLVCVINFYGK